MDRILYTDVWEYRSSCAMALTYSFSNLLCNAGVVIILSSFLSSARCLKYMNCDLVRLGENLVRVELVITFVSLMWFRQRCNVFERAPCFISIRVMFCRLYLHQNPETKTFSKRRFPSVLLSGV